MVVPAVLEFIRLGLLKKAAHDKSYQNPALANFSAAVVGIGSAQETFGYNVDYMAELIADHIDNNSSNYIPNEQALILLPFALALASISGIIGAIHHKNKLYAEWDNHPSEANLLETEMLELPPDHSRSSTNMVLQSLSKLPLKQNGTNKGNPAKDELFFPLLDKEEDMETGLSTYSSTNGVYTPPSPTYC